MSEDNEDSEFSGVMLPWSDTSWSNPSSYDYRPTGALSQNPLITIFTAATTFAGIAYGLNYDFAMMDIQGDSYEKLPVQTQAAFTIALLAGACHIGNIFMRANSRRGLGGGNGLASLLGAGGGITTGLALYNMFPAVIPQ